MVVDVRATQELGGALASGHLAKPPRSCWGRICGLVLAAIALLACEDGLSERPTLSLSSSHSCSADSLDGVVCWGDNRLGQTRVPLSFTRGVQGMSVAAGEGFTCASRPNAIGCWGSGEVARARVPALGDLGKPVQVVAGARHACARSQQGRVRCWGNDSAGQVSDMPRLMGVTAVAAGGDVTCAIAAGRVACWGAGAPDLLRVPALRDPTQLAVGAAHACALTSGRVVCWGDDSQGQVSTMPLLQQPVELAAGGDSTCVIHGRGVSCWGGARGNAGAAQPRDLTFPTLLSVGGARGQPGHGCAFHQQGIACWGDNARGQASYPGSENRLLFRAEATISATPEQVWSVLDDLDRYGEWNPFTVKMTSTKRIGDPMVMQVKLSGEMTQTENIRVWTPGYKMCWGIDDALDLGVNGERCQWLELTAAGRTRYVTEDYIGGSNAPLVSLLYGDALKEGFESVARTLKQRVERLF